MMSFFSLSAMVRALFALWAFLLCTVCVAGLIHAFSYRRYGSAAVTFSLFAPSYCVLYLIHEVFLQHRNGCADDITVRTGAFGWIWWVLTLLFLTALIVWALISLCISVRRGGGITSQTIKLCADCMPCGICYWRDNGRVVLSNACMDSICLALTGRALLNGGDLRASVRQDIMTVDGKVWQFTCRDIMFDGAPLHEMIANDISEIHAKTEALERDNDELLRLKQQLRDYNLSIDDTVRSREILQAKVRIHDEMNRLILSAAMADESDPGGIDDMFCQWEKNIMLLHDQREYCDEHAAVRLQKLARTLGVCMEIGSVPEILTEGQRKLFYTAAQEALTNAVKHAGAKRVTVSFEEDANHVCCVFENDGHVCASVPAYAGGLLNLERLAGQLGAQISVLAGETFRLTLTFPKAI